MGVFDLIDWYERVDAAINQGDDAVTLTLLDEAEKAGHPAIAQVLRKLMEEPVATLAPGES